MDTSDQFLSDGYVQEDSEAGEHQKSAENSQIFQFPMFFVEGGMLREQDRFLPIANIAKIMKKAIPNK